MFRPIQVQKLGGVQVPDTPLITAALDLARKHSADFAYNHIVRSFLFSFIIAGKIPALADRDFEVQAIAAILHDLGWDPTGEMVSPDKRFEVDGANAARVFLEKEAEGSKWDKHRIQLVWNAIALHTTLSIALHQEPEVQACALGVLADFQGPDKVMGGLLTWEEYDGVVRSFPRLEMIKEVRETLCGLCRTKPETTYDNFVADYGEKFVEGYERVGKRPIDVLETCDLDERKVKTEEDE